MQLAARMYASGYVNPGKQIIKNLFKVMKLTIIILLAACLTASATGFGQQVTLHQKSITLQKLFKEIRKQTGYVFFYDAKLISGARAISIDVTNVSVSEALRVSLKDQKLDFSIENKTITITRSSASPKAEATNVETAVLIDISGKVTNEDGASLQGATVKVRGGNNITSTNTEGIFLLKGVDSHATLEVSFVGYESMAVPVKERTSITIALKLNVVTNAEVIVRKGYYDEKKALSTGNVSTVTAKEIERQPVNNPLLALQGRVPGVMITQANGIPGGSISVEIRGGLNSLYASSDPLFIVDGVPYPLYNLPGYGSTVLGQTNNSNSVNPFSYLNPANIESIDILKDADATAIYGSRGANGVVLITTKKGKPGRIKVSLNMQSGFGKVTRKMKVLNTRQYLDMRYEAFKNDGAVPNPNVDYDLTLWDTTRNTDWQKELIGGTAHYNDVQISLSGGNANLQYLIGSGYHRETTVFPGDFRDQKANVHFNINSVGTNERFKISLSGEYAHDDNLLCYADFTEQALKLAPNAPALYNPDGSVNWAPTPSGNASWPGGNPIAKSLGHYRSKGNNLVSNSSISYKILSSLELKLNLGYNNMQTNSGNAVPLVSFDPATRQSFSRYADFADNNIQSWSIEPQINYNTKWLGGTITSLFGGTIQQTFSKALVLSATGFNSDLVLDDIKSATNVIVGSTVDNIYKYAAAFGRVNYNLRDKYIINIIGRRDGSSRFGPANKYHNFWSVGGAWLFSKESWSINKIFSNGKIRASYGETGNDQLGDYTFMDLYNSSSVGVPYLGANGIFPDRIFTPDLQWELTKKLEAGLDLGFFNDRVLINFSYYRNLSSNQLVPYLLPSISGFSNVFTNLDAVIRNRGLEAELKVVPVQQKDLQWTSAINFSRNVNTLLSVGPGVSDYIRQNIGISAGTNHAFQFFDVDPVTGVNRFVDSKGRIIPNPDAATDQTALWNARPKFFGGFQNTITYKKFQLDFLFQFVKQPTVPIYYSNYIPGYFSLLSQAGTNQPVYVLDRWQRPGDVAHYQRFSQNFSVLTGYAAARFSTVSFGEGSYIRLKNVSLSFQLPKSNKSKSAFDVSLVVRGQNLLTLTKYKGLDPETKSWTTLPPLRVLTFGLNAGF